MQSVCSRSQNLLTDTANVWNVWECSTGPELRTTHVGLNTNQSYFSCRKEAKGMSLISLLPSSMLDKSYVSTIANKCKDTGWNHVCSE